MCCLGCNNKGLDYQKEIHKSHLEHGKLCAYDDHPIHHLGKLELVNIQKERE